MILLLESHPNARGHLEGVLAQYLPVYAPNLAQASSLGDVIADVLRDGRCSLVVLGDEIPGTSSSALIRLLRAYIPTLPAIVMTRHGATVPPLEGVIAVPYEEFVIQLGLVVDSLLEEERETRSELGSSRSPTLTHSPTLTRLNAS
ncbi:MAG: response regulator transcription factor [Planctomycetes bacterium]|nr:response regulator transcription factor [Planctomycetota bacterium]